MRARLVELGQEIPPRDQQTPNALRAYRQAEIDKWWPNHQGGERQRLRQL